MKSRGGKWHNDSNAEITVFQIENSSSRFCELSLSVFKWLPMVVKSDVVRRIAFEVVVF